MSGELCRAARCSGLRSEHAGARRSAGFAGIQVESATFSRPLYGLCADGRPIAAATNARQVGVQHSPAFYDVGMGTRENARAKALWRVAILQVQAPIIA